MYKQIYFEKNISGSDKMKKIIIISISIILLISFVIWDSGKSNQNMNNITVTVSEKNPQKYILKDYNGRIAVFYIGSETPNEIYEIYTHNLPEIDAQKIKRGIEITGIDNLNKIIADYTS